MVKKEDCFIKITNRDIYEKLDSIESKISKMNNKVNIAFWTAGTALTLSIIALTNVVSGALL